MLSDEGCPVKLFKHLQFRNEILLDWNQECYKLEETTQL